MLTLLPLCLTQQHLHHPLALFGVLEGRLMSSLNQPLCSRSGRGQLPQLHEP